MSVRAMTRDRGLKGIVRLGGGRLRIGSVRARARPWSLLEFVKSLIELSLRQVNGVNC